MIYDNWCTLSTVPLGGQKYLKMHVERGVQLALACDARLFPCGGIFLGTKYKYFRDTFVGKINSLSENEYAAC